MNIKQVSEYFYRNRNIIFHTHLSSFPRCNYYNGILTLTIEIAGPSVKLLLKTS